MPTENSARGTYPRWTDMLAAVQRAEAAGFNAVWIPDHLIIDVPRPGARPEGAWEAWSLVAALAAATDTIAIGLLVTCTAFRNPALLAKMATALDTLSNGRLDLGIGGGWNEHEHAMFGFALPPMKERLDRLEAAARYFEYYAGLADKLGGETIPLGPGFLDYTLREPWGVCGVIVPFNSPYQLVARSAAAGHPPTAGASSANSSPDTRAGSRLTRSSSRAAAQPNRR